MLQQQQARCRLPDGYRFLPNAEQLLMYLWLKIHCRIMPNVPILEWNVFQFNPWDLPGDLEEKRYFFCKGKWNIAKGFTSMLSSGGGHWIPIGELDEQIENCQTKRVLGMKSTLQYYERDDSVNGLSKTNWRMDRFCLVGSVDMLDIPKNLFVQLGDWVACCVYRTIYEEADEEIDDLPTIDISSDESSLSSNESVEFSYGNCLTISSDGTIETSCGDSYLRPNLIRLK